MGFVQVTMGKIWNTLCMGNSILVLGGLMEVMR